MIDNRDSPGISSKLKNVINKKMVLTDIISKITKGVKTFQYFSHFRTN